MTTVNLLPPEFRKQRSSAVLARRIRVISLLGALLIGGLYGVRTLEVVGLNRDLEDVRAEQVAVQAQIDALGDVASARDAVAAADGLVRVAMQGEVSWAEQFLLLAKTIPPGFTLTSLSAQAAPGAGPIIGTLSFSATSDGFAPTERWLIALAAQPGWANPWIGGVSGDGDEAFTVSGTVDLTTEIFTVRGGGSL